MNHPIHCLKIANRKKILQSYRKNPESVLETSEKELERVRKKIKNFYKNYLKSTGLEGYVLGISGGIDSAVVAKLLVESVGAENVYGMILPTKNTSKEDVKDAEQFARGLDIKTNNPADFQRNIGEIVKKFERMGEIDGGNQRIKRGNILSRCRMIVTRDVAKAKRYLVSGTTNASEKLLGYTTLAGDGKGGVDCEGLYEMFKTTVYSLAKHMDIPERIIKKDPSGDLWKDQKDKKELGFDYNYLDKVLAGYCLGLKPGKIADITGFNRKDVKRTVEKVRNNSYKHLPVPCPTFKISSE